MVCFLGDAGMPDQLFGHAVAVRFVYERRWMDGLDYFFFLSHALSLSPLQALREGATASGLLDALDAGFQASLEPASPGRAATYAGALDALEHAWSRARAEWEEGEEGTGAAGDEAVVPAWEGVASLPGGLDMGAWGVAVGGK